MIETTAPACAICGYRLDEDGRHIGDDHAFITVDEYIARIPPVTWTMPERPDAHSANQRQEYVDDRLRAASEIMRLVRSAFEQSVGPRAFTVEQRSREVARLREILDGKRDEYALYELAALEIMNLPRILASSSRTQEPAHGS